MNRSLERVLLTALVVSLGGLASAQPQFKTQLVAAGFDKPSAARPLPGHPGVIAVAEQGGLIRLVQGGEVLPVPYLDLSAETAVLALGGLNNIIFHPDYETNGFIYVHYVIASDTVVLRRFERSAGDPFQADPATAFDIAGPLTFTNGFHSGGGMAWDPDGTLWLGIGDQRDLPGSQCEAQLGTSMLGKLLRLEDDGSIPADNPFVGDPTVLDEVVSVGLRQPWRLDLDPLTQDMYIADVGESDWEEVNLRPAGSLGGENYGWRVLEGPDCTGAAQCAGLSCPPAGYVAPIAQYPHAPNAVCVVGGAVYRGSALPGLDGHYVYGDFLGRLWSLRWDGLAVVETHDLESTSAPGAGLSIDTIVEIARDADGELLVVDYGFGLPGGGELYRLVPPGTAFTAVTAALPGTTTPTLEAHGTLEGESWVVFDAVFGSAAPTCFWVASTTFLGAPFKGGILGPDAEIILPSPVTAGSSHVELLWPAGVPPGSRVFVQAWIDDAAAPKGFAATPTLQGTAP